MKYTLFILFALVSTFATAQSKSPIKFDFSIDRQGEELFVVAHAIIDDGWNTYSHFTDPDGPIPTSLTIDNAEAKGQLIEEGTMVKGYDEMFDMEVTKFKKEATFRQAITDVKGTSIKGYVTYMCCDDKRCLPPVDILFDLSIDK